MPNIKGIEIDAELVQLIQHMGTVEEYRESLQALQSAWDSLTLLGHLSDTGTDMTETRESFHQLTDGLLNHLGREILKKTVLSMKSKAQMAADLMMRNLYERTADIGFLAMDDKIREYLIQVGLQKNVKMKTSRDVGPNVDEEKKADLDATGAALTERLREYVRKYSVYSNIFLLDPEGRVLLQLDPSNQVKTTHDPLVREALATNLPYVEVFRHCDLVPDEKESLIYATRVSSSEGLLGVLCTCFRFTNEVEGIFSHLIEADDWSVLTLVTPAGRTIASSDPCHVPLDAQLQLALDCNWRVTRFAGRKYLVVTRPGQAYHGYSGQGWAGHCMLPLDHAFETDSTAEVTTGRGTAIETVMHNSTLLSNELRDIPLQAAKIQHRLNRSVWNGNVRQRNERKSMNTAFSKVLHWEISRTGLKTQHVFERSINNLHQTVFSAILRNSRFQAALAIDLMDRNLYERANDCRWWALTPILRHALTIPNKINIDAASEKLIKINKLYTNYHNIVLFDAQGCIVAVSNPQYHDLCGQLIAEKWVQQTLALRDSQQYAVSTFTAHALYKNQHTYIYAAAIRCESAAQTVVGGVGLVFDASSQLASMLNDSLPRDEQGAVLADCFGVFADRNRQVIASSHPGLAPGSQMQLDETFFNAENGTSTSAIVCYDGHYYALGISFSKGYREYKSSADAYRNDVLALIFTPLKVQQTEQRQQRVSHAKQQNTVSKANSGLACMEIATFYIDNHWLGLPSENVVEAIDAHGVTSVPGSSQDDVFCYQTFRGKVIPVIGLWRVLGNPEKQIASATTQIIVLRTQAGDGSNFFGIFVDELGEITEVAVDRIEKISPILASANLLTDKNMLVESLVKSESSDNSDEMLLVISAEQLYQQFHA